MGDEFVGSREFGIYREGNDRRVTRLEQDLDASDQRHLEDVRAMQKQREEDLERFNAALRLRDEQRSRDLEAAAVQREADQKGFRATAEQRKEWTWTRLGLILTTAAALVEAYLQVRHK